LPGTEEGDASIVDAFVSATFAVIKRQYDHTFINIKSESYVEVKVKS